MIKNKQIAISLDIIARELKQITNVLDQPEKVPASTFGTALDLCTPADRRNSFNTPTKAPFSKSPLSPKPILVEFGGTSQGGRRAEISKRQDVLNFLAKGIVETVEPREPKTPTVTQMDMKKNKKNNNIATWLGIDITTWLGIGLATVSQYSALYNIRSNNNSSYYKIIEGPDKGAVLRFSNKTKLCTLDGAYDTDRFNHSSTHIGCVSCDQDGRDYVNRVIRKALNVASLHPNAPNYRAKIVRMYRPKGHAGHYTHCDLYLK